MRHSGRTYKISAMAFFLICSVVGLLWADNVGNSETLPIRSIVLYRHGVGYFERGGTVQGGQGVTLYFRGEQMNDLLKSLVAVDMSGEPISNIVYDSTKTVDQLLQEYPFHLQGGRASLSSLLSQVQGSMVEIVLPGSAGEQVRGRVVSVEERRVVENDAQQTRYFITLLEAGGSIRSFDLDMVVQFRFLDERLQEDFERYLEVLTQQNRRDEKSVTIYPGGQGARELLIGYVSAAPVWKATYRVILSTDGVDEQLNLQGWAIVDNVSEEDWENVNLSLVSGLPISFVQNLYDPLFIERPVIEMQTFAGIMPSRPEAERFARRSAGRGVAAAPMMSQDSAIDEGGLTLNDAVGGQSYNYSISSENMRQLQSQATSRDVGELFEYRIDHPVSIARNRSALLPIVAGDVNGQTVSLYNESVRRVNPMAAVRMTNTTGLTLEGGSLTVFQDGSYVGESLIETIKPDEQRYMTYAVDLGVRVESENDSERQEVYRVLIEHGVMRQFRYVIDVRQYNLTNVDDEAKTVVIEQPIMRNWDLLNGDEQLIETTDNYYRFEVEVPAKDGEVLAVRQRQTQVETIALRNVTDEDVMFYFRQNYIDQGLRDQLTRIVELKRQIADVDRQVDDLRDRRDDVTDQQQRQIEIRGQLRNTREEEALAADYIRRIREYENELDAIDSQLNTQEAQREQLQQRLNELLNNLSYDLNMQR